MVLIGLIIIANMLMALLVPGVRGISGSYRCPLPAAGPDQTAPGYRGGDIVNTFTSRGADAAPGNIYGTACAIDAEGPHAKAVELQGHTQVRRSSRRFRSLRMCTSLVVVRKMSSFRARARRLSPAALDLGG